MTNAGVAESRHEVGGVGAEAIADEDDTGELVVDRDENLRVAAVEPGR